MNQHRCKEWLFCSGTLPIFGQFKLNQTLSGNTHSEPFFFCFFCWFILFFNSDFLSGFFFFFFCWFFLRIGLEWRALVESHNHNIKKKKEKLYIYFFLAIKYISKSFSFLKKDLFLYFFNFFKSYYGDYWTIKPAVNGGGKGWKRQYCD